MNKPNSYTKEDRDIIIQRLNILSDITALNMDTRMLLENAADMIEEDRDAKWIVIRDILVDMIHDDAPIEAITWMVQYSRDFIDDMKRKENK